MIGCGDAIGDVNQKKRMEADHSHCRAAQGAVPGNNRQGCLCQLLPGSENMVGAPGGSERLGEGWGGKEGFP